MFSVSRLFSRSLGRQGLADAKALSQCIEQHLELANRERIEQLAQSIQALPDDWQASAASHLAFIGEIAQLRMALRRAHAGTQRSAPRATQLHYMVSTLFLEECFDYLTSDPARREIVHLVSGAITLTGVRVLSRIEKIPLEQQSSAYVKADPLATHKQLVTLTEGHGHEPLAWFHNHPGTGAGSTQPSEIDLATQDRLSRIGWDAIGGIFCDGYVRFFSTSQDFEIAFYGNGVEVVSAVPRETIVKLLVQP